MKSLNLLIFEPEIGGHHPIYLRHLLANWPILNGDLNIVVTPEFLFQHTDVMQCETQANVTWHSLTEAESRCYAQSKALILQRTLLEWRLFGRYAKRLAADQALVMYLDRFQLPLALRLPVPCALSGIYFRPKLHYAKLMQQSPTLRQRLVSLREVWLWRSALHHPKFKTLFCLDPLAAESLRQLGNKPIVPLPDPILWSAPEPKRVEVLHQQLAIEAQRRVCLLFGSLHERKGILQLLESLHLLTEAQRQQITLLLVGRVQGENQARLHAAIAVARQLPGLQLILQDGFVEEATVPTWFALADLVLAPYQQHVGSSGILLWAAAAGKPVLASDYGLMGELVRQHRLGITVDSRQPSQIAQAISTYLDMNGIVDFDRTSAAQFANENSAKQFAKVLSQYLLSIDV